MKKLSIGVLGTIVGLGVLVAGVATTQVWLGILGFVGMLGGVLYATTRRAAPAPRNGEGPAQHERLHGPPAGALGEAPGGHS